MMLPDNAHYLLFDMDGTLVDTEPVGPQNFLNQLKKHGVIPTQEEQELFTRIWRRDGTDIKQDDWLPEIAQKYGIKLTEAEYLKEFYDMYAEAIIKASVLPGVDEFLHKTKEKSIYKLAVVTASKRHQVEAVVREHGWEAIFDVLVTSEDFSKHKPDPEPFMVGMEKLGANVAETVVFEDSKNGSLAGKAAGCFVVGIRAGNVKNQDLSSSDIIINDFSEVRFI